MEHAGAMLVVVPFSASHGQSGRAEQLATFLRHMVPFLSTLHLPVWIVVSTQSGQIPTGRRRPKKFNRGAINNAGLAWALRTDPSFFASNERRQHEDEDEDDDEDDERGGSGGDTAASDAEDTTTARQRRARGAVGVNFHDVDIIPDDSPAMRRVYGSVVRGGCLHNARAWKRYDTDTYLGGSLTVDVRTFLDANGYPWWFWGWGGEDDALRKRLLDWKGVPVVRNRAGAYRDLEGISTAAAKLNWLRLNPWAKNNRKWEHMAVQDEALAKKRRPEGIEELDVEVLSETELSMRACVGGIGSPAGGATGATTTRATTKRGRRPTVPSTSCACHRSSFV